MKVKSESEVAQSCPTLSDLMDCSLPGSSVHGILQARVLEWGAIAFSGAGFSGHQFWVIYWHLLLKSAMDSTPAVSLDSAWSGPGGSSHLAWLYFTFR